MKTDREYFYELVDKIPQEKLDELRKALLIMAMPEFEPTEEEKEAYERGRTEYERGEVYSMDEVFGSLNDEDDETL